MELTWDEIADLLGDQDDTLTEFSSEEQEVLAEMLAQD